LNIFLHIPDSIPYGKGRKEFIVNWFLDNPDGALAVNCRHRPQLKNDPDLRNLIKKGFLVRYRMGEFSHKTTYLKKS